MSEKGVRYLFAAHGQYFGHLPTQKLAFSKLHWYEITDGLERNVDKM